MTTTIEADNDVDTASARWSTLLAVGSVLAAVGSLAYMSVVILFPDATPREDYQNPISVAGCLIATCGLMLLGFAVLRLRADLPAWSVLATSAGLFLTAGNALFFGTGILGVAATTTDATFDELTTSGWVLAMSAPKMVLCFVGFLGLAVAGWRRRSVPRVACVLMGLAAAAALIPPHPPSVLLASIAFFVIAGRR